MDPGRRVPQGHPAPPDLLARRVTPGPAPLVRIAFAAETTKFWLVLFARTVRPTELSGHDAASVDLVHVDFVSPAGRRLRVQGKAASKMVLPTLHFRTFAGPLQTLRDSPGQFGGLRPWVVRGSPWPLARAAPLRGSAAKADGPAAPMVGSPRRHSQRVSER